MRKIDLIVVHCSATKEGQEVDIEDIRQWHKDRGFRDVGYHQVIQPDGTMQKGRDYEDIGAHVKGYNAHSIGICYIGGLDADGKAADTRTDCQKEQLIAIISYLKDQHPKARVVGHRDLSPDKNGDGVIQKNEWLKECPCFDAAKEYENI